MSKLIQICASQNDLFGLDGDGVVYQYNFNSNTWMKLSDDWADHRALPLDETQSTPKREAPRRQRDAGLLVTRRRA
jgi:hypothetical protein